MSAPQRLFKGTLFFFCSLLLGISTSPAETTSGSQYHKRESGLYRDVFDQTVYYEGTQYLDFERVYRRLFDKKKRALDVNAFDEVPDSVFFTNRHGRERMSLEDLKKGAAVTAGPEPAGKWTIIKGKFEGLSPGFFIKDAKGGKYLLKFDPLDYSELATGAEVVASRFMHAIGYNVPQYTVVYFKGEQFTIDPKARVYDDSGFQKPLTPERLEDFLSYVPKTKDGLYRASASRILQGEILGPMSLQGRRKNDPDDLVDHKDRREVRAMKVFSSWLNNYDVRESNTLDVLEEKNGQRKIQHYFIDFNSSLGARPGGPKPPHFSHEYLFDYREILKGFVSFGFWKKPWQKRWDEAGRQIQDPTVGYFDNRYFNPGRFKTQLSYYPFKDLTRADGFWAAKIIMKFTDDEIREILSTGEFSDKADRDYIAQTLIERRDLIGRYWFEQANPLDDFQLHPKDDGSYELQFEDLAVHYGFEAEGPSVYHIRVTGRNGNKQALINQQEIREKTLTLNPEWLSQYSLIHILIRTKRREDQEWGPFVRVRIQSESGGAQIAGIDHPD